MKMNMNEPDRLGQDRTGKVRKELKGSCGERGSWKEMNLSATKVFLHVLG